MGWGEGPSDTRCSAAGVMVDKGGSNITSKCAQEAAPAVLNTAAAGVSFPAPNSIAFDMSP